MVLIMATVRLVFKIAINTQKSDDVNTYIKYLLDQMQKIVNFNDLLSQKKKSCATTTQSFFFVFWT